MEYKVFTLNCWGIPLVSKDRKDRMHAIATALATSSYDVVCLQEVWTDTDFFLIRDKVTGSLPYSHYFYSGVVGSGVCIFSKHPIVETLFHKWMINGYVHKIHHGDWFGGKGVALCRIKYNEFKINIYSTHLHAEYNRKHDEYYACRVVQAFETAQFIKLTSSNADLIILAGDLNTEPGDLPFKLMTNIPHLRDSFSEKDEIYDVSTNLALKNSYTPASMIRREIPGVRIDYVLFKNGKKCSVELENYAHPFPSLVPNKPYSYSDHEAITSTLILRKETKEPKRTSEVLQIQSLNEGIQALNEGMDDLTKNKIYFALATVILLTLIVVSLFFVSPVEGLLHVIRILLTFCMCYTFVMCTIWNMIEYNTLFATKLAMEVYLKGLEKEDQICVTRTQVS